MQTQLHGKPRAANIDAKADPQQPAQQQPALSTLRRPDLERKNIAQIRQAVHELRDEMQGKNTRKPQMPTLRWKRYIQGKDQRGDTKNAMQIPIVRSSFSGAIREGDQPAKQSPLFDLRRAYHQKRLQPHRALPMQGALQKSHFTGDEPVLHSMPPADDQQHQTPRHLQVQELPTHMGEKKRHVAASPFRRDPDAL